jgi:hypothetical protein
MRNQTARGPLKECPAAARRRRPSPRSVGSAWRTGRGTRVTPPIGFAVIAQTGREPPWLTTDFPSPRYEVSTKVDTGVTADTATGFNIARPVLWSRRTMAYC